ncbi:haloacid dehalogenase-like hydrolase domain-containing protein 2 isoform X2 [Sitodiplosis mosellana]|uniref:haloacid dehalogenase-like hydrolase domain-containing protein 2 isoform X2 n=1 Tax=Sitodiplosis mosellana TaxID=263140 RepID=UPI002444192F|nr:haloacid dehalogenase-like hydrolase domain-containing protein 2 isoform X2 [Sitodiplosis mosellana]
MLMMIQHRMLFKPCKSNAHPLLAHSIHKIKRLRSINDIQLRFVTNTTKESKETLLQRLHRIGFSSISKDDMFTSLSAAVQYVKTNDLKPFYLLTEDAKKDFGEQTTENSSAATMTTTTTAAATESNDDGNENSVVVGLAPDKFVYETINEAFRVLMKENSKLIAVHEGKYFKRGDGLAVGPGCFTRGLEYASGKTATVIGKPNPYFFNCAIPEGISPHECCMIGDDINDDIFGAQNVGMKGILVKTGKYIDNIEAKYSNKPTKIAESFADAVDWLISEQFVV